MVGRLTAAGKVTVDDQTGGRDVTDSPRDATPAGAAAGDDDATLGDPATPGAERRLDATSDATSDVDGPPAAPPASTPALVPIPGQARRSPAIWAVVAALVGVLVLVVTVGAQVGALALAVVLAAAGIARAVTPGAVVGLAVRSRTFDVLVYLLLAAVVAFLAQTTPDI